MPSPFARFGVDRDATEEHHAGNKANEGRARPPHKPALDAGVGLPLFVL